MYIKLTKDTKHSTEASTNWGRRKNCTDSIRKEKSILLKIKVVIMEKTRIATFLLKSINEFEINLIYHYEKVP